MTDPQPVDHLALVDTDPVLDPGPAGSAAPTGLPAGPGVRRSASGEIALTTSVPPYPTADVLGLTLSACTLEEMVETVEAWVDEGLPRSAAGVNAHVVNEIAVRPDIRGLFQANDVNYIDGQGVVWAARALGLEVPERVATTDLARPLARMCARRGFGLFLLGGRPEVVRLAAENLLEESPGLQVEAHHGYFDPADDEDVVARINASGAEVLLVGMGDPKQQQWVRDHIGRIGPTVLLTCGGLFDWVSGTNPRPPDWMVRAGLEWAWRVYLEPRRLARRYLLGNPEFIARTALALAKQRRDRE